MIRTAVLPSMLLLAAWLTAPAVPGQDASGAAAREDSEPVAEAAAEPADDRAADTPEPDLAWEMLDTEPYPGKQDDIVFVDERTGWYGNGAGNVYRTRDGGDTWTRVLEQPGTFVRALGFVDERVGVLGNVGVDYFPGVTDETLLYRTTDGGDTWEAVPLPEGAIPRGGICAIQVLRETYVNHGVLDEHVRLIAGGRVGGPAQLLVSDDLGKTWSMRPLPETAGMILDVHFFDRRTGLLASATSGDAAESHALVLRTEDGGHTWETVYASTRPYELSWKLAFPTDERGFVTIQSYDPDPEMSARYVARTDDGGRTWTEHLLVDDHAVREFAVGFLDAETGWVGAMPGGFVTQDGGETWSPAELGRAVNKIRFVPGEDGAVTGWAIGVGVHRLRVPGS